MLRYLAEIALFAIILALAALVGAVLQYFGKPTDKTKFASYSFILFVVVEVFFIYRFDAGIVQSAIRWAKAAIEQDELPQPDGLPPTDDPPPVTQWSGKPIAELDLQAKTIAMDYWRKNQVVFTRQPDWRIEQEQPDGPSVLNSCKLVWTNQDDVEFQLLFLINPELWRNRLTSHPSRMYISDYRLARYGGTRRERVKVTAWLIANSDRIIRRFEPSERGYAIVGIEEGVFVFWPLNNLLNEHLLNQHAIQLVALVGGEFIHYVVPAAGMRDRFGELTRCTNKLPYSSGTGSGWKSAGRNN